MGINRGLGNGLKDNIWGCWKIKYMDIAKNNLGELTNNELPIKSKVNEITVMTRSTPRGLFAKNDLWVGLI